MKIHAQMESKKLNVYLDRIIIPSSVLTLLEQRAIAYCKQRCVGVPQDLVTMSCDAQLGTKISKLKPYFR